MKLFLGLLFSTLFFQISFSQDFASWNYQTECVDVSMSKSTKIKVTNFDKKSKTDIDYEKKLGLHAVLIKGVSGGKDCVGQPPLINQDDYQNNKTYFKNLFGKKAYYNKYIIAVEDAEINELDKKKFKQRDEHSAIITIDKDLLRKDLINDKIIKSLTNGF
jgi:hypothetical protein